MQHPNGFGGGLLDGVGHAQQPGRSAVDGDEQDRLAVAAQPLGLPGQSTGVDDQLFQQLEVAEGYGVAVHGPGHALAGEGAEVLDVS